MRNASGHPGKNERHGRKSEQEHAVRHFLHKSVTRTFLDVSLCCRAKQRQINVQEKCAAREKFFFFCLLDRLLFFHRSRCLRHLVLLDFIFSLSKL